MKILWWKTKVHIWKSTKNQKKTTGSVYKFFLSENKKTYAMYISKINEEEINKF